MNDSVEAANRYVSADGNMIEFEDEAGYSPSKSVADISNDGFITKGMAIALISSAGAVVDPLSIPAGSPLPMTIDMTVAPYTSVLPGFFPLVEQLNAPFDTATESYPVWDVKVRKVYTDDTRSVLSQLIIYGHADPDNIAQTIDDLQLIFK